MSKYSVDVPIIVWAIVEVEAENENEAKEIAIDNAYLTSFAGNGTTSGKLIGTTAKNVRLEIGEVVDEIGVSVNAL